MPHVDKKGLEVLASEGVTTPSDQPLRDDAPLQSPPLSTPPHPNHSGALHSDSASTRLNDLHTYPSSVFYTHVGLGDGEKRASTSNFQLSRADLEKGFASQSKEHLTSGRNTHDPMWPGRHSRCSKKWPGRRKRNWNPLKNLDRRTKIFVKILIALTIVAVAVAIGVGISRAVGGGVWTGNDTQTQIPGSKVDER
ncbi:MAG: hypothetical protein M1833_005842 [Piccolia ochrophora]|nr:MAG: hypothetical protein M1833_005842 [Piccolia ochrophora]